MVRMHNIRNLSFTSTADTISIFTKVALMKPFHGLDPVEHAKAEMEPWNEKFISSKSIRLVVPVKIPSTNEIQASAFGKFGMHANMAKKKKMIKQWRDQIEIAVLSQPPSESVRYFKDRIGVDGIYYRLRITARLFRLYDEDNLFVKYLIDGLKGLLIKDDSKKYIVSCDIEQELIPNRRVGKKKKGTLKYVNAQGKRIFPDTIIEIEMIEREPVML